MCGSHYHHPRVDRGAGYTKRVIGAAVVDNDNLVNVSWQARWYLTYKGLFIVGGKNDMNCGVLVQDVAKVVEIRSRSAMELKTKAG